MKKEGNGCGTAIGVFAKWAYRLLTVVFVALKLCKVIAWSWWWVLSPAWIYAGLVIVCLMMIGLAALIKD